MVKNTKTDYLAFESLKSIRAQMKIAKNRDNCIIFVISPRSHKINFNDMIYYCTVIQNQFIETYNIQEVK